MFASRLASFVTVLAAGAALLGCGGCGKDKAANAPLPPQTLSEPVRVAEHTEEAPVAPVAQAEAPQTGQSRQLPTFVSPDPVPAPPVVAPLPTAATSAGGGRFHTLAKGESLAQLSRKYGVGLRALINANNFKDPNKLAVGTKVSIP